MVSVIWSVVKNAVLSAGAMLGGFGWRTFFMGSFLLVVVIYAYNLIHDILEEMIDFLVNHYSEVSMPTGFESTYSFSGLLGWLVSVLQIPECVAFMVTMIALKFTLRKIPLIRW